MSNIPNKHKPGLAEVKKKEASPYKNSAETVTPNDHNLNNSDPKTNTFKRFSYSFKQKTAKISKTQLVVTALVLLLLLNFATFGLVWSINSSNQDKIKRDFSDRLANLASAVGLSKQDKVSENENYKTSSEVIEQAKNSVVVVEKLVSSETVAQIRETIKNRFANTVSEKDYLNNTSSPKDYWEPLGSGIIVRSNGLIVTNKHVVASSGQYRVRTVDDQSYPVRRVMIHPYEDIALLKASDANPTNNTTPIFTPINFSENKPLAGEEVYTIGHPARLSFSVSKGIISNPDKNFEYEIDNYLRKVTLPDYLEKAYFADSGQVNILPVFTQDFMSVGARIQHTATINLGSSGGALLDSQGRLLGMNTFAIEDPSYDTYNLIPNIENPFKSIDKPEDLEKSVVRGYSPRADFNINGAIGASLIQGVLSLYEKASESGKPVSLASVGVQAENITPSTASLFGLPVNSGIRLARMFDPLYAYDLPAVQPGGGAEKAGLKENDIISAINDQELSSKQTIGQILQNKQPGEKVKISFFRQNADKIWENQSVELTLGSIDAWDEESIKGLKLGNISI